MTYEETIEWIFLSTLSLRRATGDAFYLDLVSGISIHALLAESDVFCQCKKRVGSCISIHALLAESDNHATLDAGGNDLFLSTLSLRRATWRGTGYPPQLPDFYPRSPCGERPHFHLYTDLIVSNFYPRSPCGERLQGQCPPGKEPVISIHALLAESDHSVRPSSCPAYRFLSTLSLRRATHISDYVRSADIISIHALLAESDACQRG